MMEASALQLDSCRYNKLILYYEINFIQIENYAGIHLYRYFVEKIFRYLSHQRSGHSSGGLVNHLLRSSNDSTVTA